MKKLLSLLMAAAMMVTILPNGTEAKAEDYDWICEFEDVQDSGAYYKAVLWAVEQGITTGKKATNHTTFDPLGECTKSMSVTFIYRYAN